MPFGVTHAKRPKNLCLRMMRDARLGGSSERDTPNRSSLANRWHDRRRIPEEHLPIATSSHPCSCGGRNIERGLLSRLCREIAWQRRGPVAVQLLLCLISRWAAALGPVALLCPAPPRCSVGTWPVTGMASRCASPHNDWMAALMDGFGETPIADCEHRPSTAGGMQPSRQRS